ncbi:P-loop containing nucleoside triphosphate hydrolase protein [Mycena metata]|uniref:RNA helicase n=1 Tax=Mycena metata TaxID=1033252 RepID=A0AAD7JIU4_9AGAR|nr:P-loop containing nucleoside triphosphate hydrolase protein [Mycena metata]
MQGLLWASSRPRVAPLQWVACRFRQQVARPKPRSSQANSPYRKNNHAPGAPSGEYFGGLKTPHESNAFPGLKGHNLPLDTISAFFHSNAEKWVHRRVVHDRLVAFGAQPADATKLLAAFVRDVSSGFFNTPEAFEKYHLIKFTNTEGIEADVSFSNVFFRWLAVRGEASPSTAVLLRISEAASNLHPAEEYEGARKMRRKFVMHVGPTNSGKTYHALRALAAAPVGLYAGPLRLLAYEIWERLNLGQIAPLGATDEQIAEAAKVGSSVDNPFARPCNMITGEEQKIVETNAKVLSCTVEMLNLGHRVDVAVIDEIQMIADRDRGAAWTRAVLGLCAHEIHLCGEETSVPLIEKLLAETGDELVVNRYERLTPLTVEKKSLDGDLSGVMKGDCIVAFSRTAIFSMKKEIEALTGMRCAVVYGKLPPEIRSEQAALFNDPNSGYDVLIGSDAIGMGLNLKIRRIIFESVYKWSGPGIGRVIISVSQMKQIAGRAGRFGMQETDEVPGGFVTTLNPEDLPVLKKTLPIQIPPLPFARIAATRDQFSELAGYLPPTAATETVFLAHIHAGNLPIYCRASMPPSLSLICEYLDQQGYFTYWDRLQLIQAPFPWRDRMALDAITEFVATYYQTMYVDVTATMRKLGYLDKLEAVELVMQTAAGVKRPKRFNHSFHLDGLETFHKILVVYLWLSYRNPVSYPAQDLAVKMKERLERALHWCLEEMSLVKGTTAPVSKPAIVHWRSERDQKAAEMDESMGPSPSLQ